VQVSIEGDSEVDTLKATLVDCGYVLGRAAVAMNLSRGELIKAIKKAGLRCPIVVSPNSKFDEATIRLMIEDMKKGVSWSEMRGKFDCSDDILQVLPVYAPELAAQSKTSRRQNRINDFRKVVDDAVESGLARTEIRNSFPTELSYLDRHDRAWLLKRLALVPCLPKAAPKKGVGRGQGIRDRSEGGRLLFALKAALQAAKSLEPPRRVSKTLLMQTAGLKSSLFGKLERGRHAEVRAFLVANEEQYEDFIERKLAFAFRKLEAATPIRPITLVRLRLASGLTEAVLISHKALIEDHVRASPLAVSPLAVPWLRDARRAGAP